MLIIFCTLLSFKVWCTDDLFFGTKTIGVGESATLTCARPTSDYKATLYWIRIVSGSWPEFLGGTFAFDYVGVNKTPHITTKQEPGTFILEITEVNQSDTGLYYCIKVKLLAMTFLKGTFLRIKEPTISDTIQVFPSDHVHPGNPVTLQCSVLSNSENKTCPRNHSVFWFNVRSDKSQPNVIYPNENSDKCEKIQEASSTQKCVYSFSKTVSSSDAGSYYCAVATCGQIIFGNGIRLDANTAIFLLCAVLVTSLVVIAYLIYTIKKKTCNCCKGNTTFPFRQSDLKVFNSVIYSSTTFTWRKTDKVEQMSSRKAEETVYTGVRDL
uniref:Ig-like domain-containing protein n=1 Tax=Pundamilia nyererei TaxID=303518 RepID=A0A3B4G2I0_9CICH